MSASGLAMASWLKAGSCSVSPMTAFVGALRPVMSDRMILSQISAMLPLPRNRIGSQRFSSSAAASSSLFCGSSLSKCVDNDDDDDHHHWPQQHSRSASPLYCIRRDYFTPCSEASLATTMLHGVVSASPRVGGGESTLCPSAKSRMRRRALSSSRLSSSRNDEEEPEKVQRPTGPRRSREEAFYGSSIPASKRRPPEEDDIWSKHSVFEFKSLNDPDTNASCYKGLAGQPGRPSAQREESARGPPPELRLTSDERPTLDDREAEFQRMRGSETEPDSAGDFFQFREKESLANGRSKVAEVRRTRVSSGGDGSSASSAVKVEVATQLGLPATSTYEELRAAYRVEMKRCHPDVAGDNEFRIKFLERRFQRLRLCWDKFLEEREAIASGRLPADGGAANQAAEAARVRAQEREQVRAEAEAKKLKEAAAAEAAARRSGRRVMDPGRNILDAGGPSC